MTNVETRAGDVLLTTLPGSGLSSAIIRTQRRLSPDGYARYSHAAHFDCAGVLLDTLWTVQLSYIEDYEDRPCAIYRPMCSRGPLERAVNTLRLDLGQRYPWQRLFLHLFGLADNIHWTRLVCSERVARMLHLAFREDGVFDFERHYGWTPDMLDDHLRTSYEFKLLWEGIL